MISYAVSAIAQADITDGLARNAIRLLALADPAGKLVIRYEDLASLFGVGSIDVVRKYLRLLAAAQLLSWESAGGIFYIGFVAFVSRAEVSATGHFPAQTGHKRSPAPQPAADPARAAKWSPWDGNRPVEVFSRPVEDSHARPTNGI